MTKKSLSRNYLILIFSFFFFILPVFSVFSFADEAIDSLQNEDVNILIGDLQPLKVYGLTRLSIIEPNVADILDASSDEVLLIGKTVGATPLFIWDEKGKRAVVIHVFNQPLELTINRLKKLFKSANITEAKMEINEKEGKIVLSGDIPEDKGKTFNQIIEPFAGNLINIANVAKIKDLVQIDIQATELHVTLDKVLGIDWNDSLSYAEQAIPAQTGGKQLLKIGNFGRGTPLNATVNMLVTDGKARVLSKPRLVVVNGEVASFNVGGSVPILSSTLSSVGTAENVSFHPYGITMSITPTIINKKIDLVMNVDISDIDESVKNNGNVGYTTRSAQTRLYLDDGQSIALAGFIKQRSSETIKRLPIIGKVPVFGWLFGLNTSKPRDDTELVISVTPHILFQSQSDLTKDLSGAPIEAIKAQAQETQNSQTTNDAEVKAAQKAKLDNTPNDVPPALTGYVQEVQKKILAAVQYPPEAEKYGWEGTVRLGLLILRDGSLAFATVKQSSGYDIFDRYALTTAKDVAPYLSFPPETDLQELNVTIPIVYSLKKN